MLHKVVALDTYKRLGVTDIGEGKVLDVGYEFEVNDERLEILLGKNEYKVAFVKKVEKKRARKKSE